MALAMASRLTRQPSQTRRARSPASRRVFHAAETDVDVFPPAWDRGGFVDDRVEQWLAAGLAGDHVPGLNGARRRLQLRKHLQGFRARRAQLIDELPRVADHLEGAGRAGAARKIRSEERRVGK